MSETTRLLRRARNETLLKTFAALTHRLHVADRNSEQRALASDLRAQRDIVQEEILRRMR